MHVAQRDALTVRAPAKINLFLEILGKRSDGYHEIVTFMTAVDLFDELTFTPSADGAIRLECDDPALPTGPDNLVWRAAEKLRTVERIHSGVQIQLAKRIPAGAGLGGGSSDAAATLVALNRLWDLGLSLAALEEIGTELGSDVPFFVRILGHPVLQANRIAAAWCSGRGEKVSPVLQPQRLHFAVACPAVGLSTAEVYKGVTVPNPSRSAAAFQAASVGSVPALGAELFNRLQPVAERLCPEVAALRQVMEKLAPPGHVMSGSGSAYVALCSSRKGARALARQVPRLFHSVTQVSPPASARRRTGILRPSSPGTGPREDRGLRLFVVSSPETVVPND